MNAERSSPSSHSHKDGDDHIATPMKIEQFPGHYMNHDPHNITDANSVEYWASPPGQVRDQAFVFDLEQSQVVVRVEWKDRGDDMGVAKMSLEALVGDGWQKLSTWDATQTCEWQSHTIVVQAVRLIIRLAQPSPAHNVVHSQYMAERLWKDRRFTDVEMICGESKFQLHRAVLAAASPVFERMLGSDMTESRSQQIVISDVDENAIEHALEYIYTGHVAEKTGCQVIVLGHKYDIPGLVEYAAPVALGNLTTENVSDEVRVLRSYANDPLLGPVFQALQNKVHENLELFNAVLLGI